MASPCTVGGAIVHIAAFVKDTAPCAGKLANCRLAASAYLFIMLQVDRSDPRNIEAGNITPDNAEKKVSIPHPCLMSEACLVYWLVLVVSCVCQTPSIAKCYLVLLLQRPGKSYHVTCAG